MEPCLKLGWSYDDAGMLLAPAGEGRRGVAL